MNSNDLLLAYARQLMDPATAKAQNGYVPLPTIEFDLAIPDGGTTVEDVVEDVAEEEVKQPIVNNREGEGGDSTTWDERNSGGRDTPYAWDEDYWGGSFAPDYSWGDALKSFAYGKGLKSNFGILSSVLGLNNIMDPRKDPAIRTGIEQFASHYGLSANEAWDKINQAIDGTENKKTGFLSGLMSMLGDTSANKTHATDAIKGALMGMVTDKNNPELNLGQYGDIENAWALGQVIDAMNRGYNVSLDDLSGLSSTPTDNTAMGDVFGNLLDYDPVSTISTQIKEMMLNGNAPGETLGDALSGSGFNEYASGRMANTKTGLTDSLRDVDLTAPGASAAMAQAVSNYQSAKSAYKDGSYNDNASMAKSNREAARRDQERRDSLRGGDGGGSDHGDRGGNDGARDSGGNHGANEGNAGDTGRGDSTSSSSGSACFPAGTAISVEGGHSTVPIELVKKGDSVVTWDINAGRIDEDVVNKVSQKTVNSLCTISFRSGASVTCTPNHPLVTQSGLASVDPAMTKSLDNKDVEQLAEGSSVITLDSTDEVVSISTREGSFEVYNLDDIGGESTFFADGICVHNKW